MDPFETTIVDVLSQKQMLAKHPGGAVLGSDLYSNAHNSVSELMERQRYSGQYLQNANSLTFGSTSSFFLQPGSVLGALYLAGTVQLGSIGSTTYTAPDFWMLELIDSVELIISGSSSVQSLRINGASHRDYLFSSLTSEKLRGLRDACRGFSSTATLAAPVEVSGAIPIHTFFSSPELESLFPLDSSTLSSQIILNVRWKQLDEVFRFVTTDSVVPTSYSRLIMRVAQQVQLARGQPVADRLKMDPSGSLIYSIPGPYIQSFVQRVVVDTSDQGLEQGEQQVVLTSQPSGMLQCILVSCKATAYSRNSADGLTPVLPWYPINSIRVLYNGIELYRAANRDEIQFMNVTNTDCDSGVSLDLRANCDETAVPAENALDTANITPVIIIPMANEISKVLRERRHENVKDYSGSSIQFFFTMRQGPDFYPAVGNYANGPIGTTPAPAVQSEFIMNFTYVNSGLYEISGSTISLDM